MLEQQPYSRGFSEFTNFRFGATTRAGMHTHRLASTSQCEKSELQIFVWQYLLRHRERRLKTHTCDTFLIPWNNSMMWSIALAMKSPSVPIPPLPLFPSPIPPSSIPPAAAASHQPDVVSNQALAVNVLRYRSSPPPLSQHTEGLKNICPLNVWCLVFIFTRYWFTLFHIHIVT